MRGDSVGTSPLDRQTRPAETVDVNGGGTFGVVVLGEVVRC